jgi:hypothetical protein
VEASDEVGVVVRAVDDWHRLHLYRSIALLPGCSYFARRRTGPWDRQVAIATLSLQLADYRDRPLEARAIARLIVSIEDTLLVDVWPELDR